MIKNKDLVIVGDSAFAEIAYEYFLHDSSFNILGFVVEKPFITKTKLFGLPVYALEDIEKYFNAKHCYFFVAVVYTQLNRLRSRLYETMRNKGFSPASYISSKSSIWRNVILGEHCFIFEENTIQPFVSIGDNVVIWSGNHIGHHSAIGSNCFLSSHVVISGFCNIGDYSFLGVNSTISNNVSVAIDNWIGPNVLIEKDTHPDMIFKEKQSGNAIVSSKKFFKVK